MYLCARYVLISFTEFNSLNHLIAHLLILTAQVQILSISLIAINCEKLTRGTCTSNIGIKIRDNLGANCLYFVDETVWFLKSEIAELPFLVHGLFNCLLWND